MLGIYRLAVAVVLFGSSALAHMQLRTPFPIGSKFDSRNTGLAVDYNMARPMASDGSDYPCMNAHHAGGHVTATYKAGGSYEIEIAGAAPHNGGSCQLSLSYDNGVTFKVIKSIIGNCPVQTTWGFTVPSTVPSGRDVLFAWSWINKTGNREMYMNCARVNIENDAYAFSDTSLDSLPEIFKANIFGDTCQVGEGIEVVYPNPGEQVEYGNPALKGTVPTEVTGCPADSGHGAPAYVSSTSSFATPISPVYEAEETARFEEPENLVTEEVARVAKAPTSTPVVSTATTPSTPSTPSTMVTRTKSYTKPTASSTPGSCAPNTILCSDDGASFSVCDHTVWVSMGSVASGTICSNGKIVRDSALGACDVDGKTRCLENGTKWATCAQGAWVLMGDVAAGTSCADS